MRKAKLVDEVRSFEKITIHVDIHINLLSSVALLMCVCGFSRYTFRVTEESSTICLKLLIIYYCS